MKLVMRKNIDNYQQLGQKFVLACHYISQVSPEKFLILCYMQKDHFVAENIRMNIQLINFNILLGLSLTLICFTNDKKLF